MRISYNSGKYITAIGVVLTVYGAMAATDAVASGGLTTALGILLIIFGGLLWAIGNARKS